MAFSIVVHCQDDIPSSATAVDALAHELKQALDRTGYQTAREGWLTIERS